MSLTDILVEIRRERARQDEKWGRVVGDCCHPDTPDGHRLAVLAEEVGEVGRAMLDAARNTPGEPGYNPSASTVREELVQVAAVAVAWLEGIDASADLDAIVSELA